MADLKSRRWSVREGHEPAEEEHETCFEAPECVAEGLAHDVTLKLLWCPCRTSFGLE